MQATLGHGTGEGGRRLPLGRGPGGGLLHHLVDLLERQALGLGNQEVRVDKGAGTQAAPDEEDGRLEVALVGSNHVLGRRVSSMLSGPGILGCNEPE